MCSPALKMDLESGTSIRSQYGLEPRSSRSGGGLSPEHHLIIRNLRQLVRAMLARQRVNDGMPLFWAWCVLIECCLHHGFLRPSPTSLFSRSDGSNVSLYTHLMQTLQSQLSAKGMPYLHGQVTARESHELIDLFTAVNEFMAASHRHHQSGSILRLRLWIRLALMKGCLAAGLRLYSTSSLAVTLYVETSLFRDRQAWDTVLDLIGEVEQGCQLEIYLRMQDLPKLPFPPWHKLVQSDGLLCLEAVDGRLLGFYICEQDGEEQVTEETKRSLHRRIAVLTDSNRQLRHALSRCIAERTEAGQRQAELIDGLRLRIKALEGAPQN